MPSARLILQTRARRSARSRSLGHVGAGAAGLAAAVALAAGGVSWATAASFDNLISDLPPATQIEQILGRRSEESIVPSVLTDRTGQFVIETPASPALESGRWLPLRGAPASESIPEAVAQAAVAALDPTFWTNPGYEPGSILTSFRLPGSEESEQTRPGITERLVDIMLLPFDLERREPLARWVRRAFQSARLTEQYPKERILEWFLNTADFGRSAFGLDAAAMAYLNKRGPELTLGEAASLVGLLLDGPVEAPVDLDAVRRKRDRVIESMAEQGLIGRTEARRAMREEPRWIAAPSQASGPAAEFSAFVREQLRSRFGAAAGRPGLRVRTTLDYDVQLQADCTVRSHLARMAGGDPDAVLAARDESPCIVAGLLSPLRPGDAGRDHGIGSAALVVLDAARGEVLAWVGPSDAERPAEPVFRPFVYLAAFARGYTPATMVLDLPPQGSGAAAAGDFRGPVRMRIGLANGLVGATQHTLNLLDVEQVIHVARQMGLRGLQDPEPGAEESWSAARAEASLLDLAYAYSVMAHGGRMTGVERPGTGLVPGSRQVDPIVILSLEDPTGTVYVVEPMERSVLSPALAFVMSDVLTDESARRVSQSGLGISGVGRVAGVVDGEADGGRQHWTVGFSSPRVVGVWVSAGEGEILSEIDAYNGSAPVWRAMLQYATRDLAFEPMPRPPGITDLEVCDPSGLLPTAYCPNIVREIFLQGTEPIHYDTLFRPFQVNRETGKLATLFTPLDLIEQRVYLIPPAEAAAWARSVGLERPPTEYDALGELPPQDPQVNLQRPIAFEALRGTVVIRGTAAPASLDFFRLQYGEGLNPTHWVILGEEVRRPVDDGVLGTWDTAALNGLFTLQLVVVDRQGRVRTAAVPLLVDNEPPLVHLVLPAAGQEFSLSEGEAIVLEAEASDSGSLDRVEFVLDGRVVGSVSRPPYSLRWSGLASGLHTLFARATDSVGNVAQSDSISFAVFR